MVSGILLCCCSAAEVLLCGRSTLHRAMREQLGSLRGDGDRQFVLLPGCCCRCWMLFEGPVMCRRAMPIWQSNFQVSEQAKNFQKQPEGVPSCPADDKQSEGAV